MKILPALCACIRGSEGRSEPEAFGDTEKSATEGVSEASHESIEELNPRDGMSLDSAKFIIRGCTEDEQHELLGIENKGRYFIAKIVNSGGTVVNHLLVDKLNGRVQFLRGK